MSLLHRQIPRSQVPYPLLHFWEKDNFLAFDLSWLCWLYFSKLFATLLKGRQLPPPYIYPTPEGLIGAEWSTRMWEVIAIFDLLSHSIRVLVVRVETNECLLWESLTNE